MLCRLFCNARFLARFLPSYKYLPSRSEERKFWVGKTYELVRYDGKGGSGGERPDTNGFEKGAALLQHSRK